MRYQALEPASLAECMHEAILAERKYPGFTVTTFDWDRRRLTPEQLQELIAIYIDELADPNNTAVRIPFSLGADIVIRRGEWVKPHNNSEEEDEAI